MECCRRYPIYLLAKSLRIRGVYSWQWPSNKTSYCRLRHPMGSAYEVIDRSMQIEDSEHEPIRFVFLPRKKGWLAGDYFEIESDIPNQDL